MIRVVQGPITALEVDAVVRPIRSDLSAVSSVSRDLGTAAGEAAEERLQQTGLLPVGGAVLTPAGNLPCGFVIHAVVMSDEESQTATTVERALKNALARAVDWDLESLALPPVGIGVGMTEPEVQARALVKLLMDHLREGRPPHDLVIVVSSDFEADLFGRLIDEAAGDETLG